ncbi:SPW repeat domain-containing protein [Actinokineospora iranica]|uniref:SPW repeat-containing integral membrane domain-containing protein n=1 Tax=Actinokineospora iranica TaxID=1271860 RepID=A0A1G6UCG7_9PSEU|nr:hypothetical protein [Actinokineospora iranica]SDD38924.1 hypothetical protein SAMN05216174_110205 [Actinokineospora iranica]
MTTTTTPAAKAPRRIPGPQLPGLVSGVTLVLGCGLVVLSLHGDYGTPTGFDAPWNDRIAGLAAAALGLVRVMRKTTLLAATTLGAVLGIWLLTAPMLVDYGFGVESTLATGADVVAGVAIASLSVLGHLHAGDSTASSGGAEATRDRARSRPGENRRDRIGARRHG